jgi:hypothetical protein
MMPSMTGTTKAEDLPHDPNNSEGIPSVVGDRVGGRGEANRTSAAAEVQDLAPAPVPSDNGEPDEDLGAFDDSHLQHDEPKKKKKKKKNKPKSKRGLVIYFLPR